MMMIGLGEIFVVVVLRPVRFLLGGSRTPLGRGMLKLENWLLHHLHVMGAESQMRYELEKHGQAASFLASGATDQTSTLPSTSDAVNRARRQSGADHDEAMKSAQRLEPRELGRGQRQVESRGGDRSDDIQEALMQAQRERNQQAERERRQSFRHRR